MARIEDIERRLLNWARWKAGVSTGIGFGASGIWNGESARSTYREARIPTVDCEASETDQAVQALPADLGKAVGAAYVLCPNLEQAAAACSCSVSTIHARVDRAHVAISQWLTSRAELARAEAARIQSLRWPPIGRGVS